VYACAPWIAVQVFHSMAQRRKALPLPSCSPLASRRRHKGSHTFNILVCLSFIQKRDSLQEYSASLKYFSFESHAGLKASEYDSPLVRLASYSDCGCPNMGITRCVLSIAGRSYCRKGRVAEGVVGCGGDRAVAGEGPCAAEAQLLL